MHWNFLQPLQISHAIALVVFSYCLIAVAASNLALCDRPCHSANNGFLDVDSQIGVSVEAKGVA